MSTTPVTLRRNQRPDEPEMPSGELVIEPPPPLQEHDSSGSLLVNVIPMLGSIGSIVMVAGLGGRGGGPLAYVAGGLFLFATLGFLFVQYDRQRKQRAQQVTGSRSEYLRYLNNVRRVTREAADQQRQALTWHHPAPSALPSFAEDRSRVWERSSSDPRFLHVRYGLSSQPLAMKLVPPEHTPVDQVDPAAASALHRLLVVHRVQHDLPASLDLRAFATVEVCGLADPARAAARALICSATAFHSPDQLAIAVLAGPQTLANWDWLKWLPHNQSGERTDAVGPMRMVSTSLDELIGMLPRDLADRPRFGADDRPAAPHLLIVVDGNSLPPGNHLIPADGLHGVTVVALRDSLDDVEDATVLKLAISGPRSNGVAVRAHVARQEPIEATLDQCDAATAEAFARRLTPLHTAHVGDGGTNEGPADFIDLLGFGDVHSFDPTLAWRRRPARDRLRVPVGTGDSGTTYLDIKESAQQGMGPHGLVIGATGSGKSEFLRTLVLGLAMTHSPEQLNMVLVDFKGGATFAGMAGMPQVSAVITNLAEELTLVDRMQDALSGEMVRRQELLRDAGNFQSIRDYERAREAGEALAPLPSLFIVVDEFSEMLTAKPEFIDLFVAIGRLGRSLGLHLLLASQRLEEGRLRGLESHLSYRVGLRTFSAAESRAVLGVPDAYELPAEPGLGFLKPDPTTMERFRAGYVSGPPTTRGPRNTEAQGNRRILPFSVAEVPDLTPESEAPEEPTGVVDRQDDSVLDIAVRAMQGHGPAAHQVWLPPLDVPDTLDRLLPDLTADPQLGLISPHWRAAGGPGALVVPLGILDRPREQRRDVLTVNLTGAAGHVAVVGGPRSGKSTLLRTILCSLSLTRTPLETQFFVLDFGGGAFAPLASHPHVAGVASRSEPDVVRRIVAEVTGVVDRREAYFREHGIDSIETYRSRREAGQVDDGYGDLFLVVDGWSTLRTDFDELELEIQTLAARGLTFGLHLVSGATRWSDYRAAMRDLFGTRLELRLGDSLDSEVDRKVAELVPAGRPGRGLVPTKHHFLGALPRIDGVVQPASLGDGLADLVAKVRSSWQGPPAPKLRLLPASIELTEVREMAPDSPQLLLGINERQLAPVGIDAVAEPHLLAFGDAGSGKSALLRSLMHEVMRAQTAKQAQLVVVDYRRTLLGEVPDEYLLNYLTNAALTTPALAELATYLKNRLPGNDVSPEQLRNRNWWTGAEVYVVVDDYDLVATQQSSPLAPLVELLPQARDVGLHVIVARRSGGASRAMYESVIQAMRELQSPGVILAGSPEEGPLIGNVKPTPGPPGRGRLITRGSGVETVQFAWTPPTL